MDTISSWKNPFEGGHSLVHLTSGIEAPKDVTEDLLGAYNRGSVALADIIEKRLQINDQTSFYSPIHRLNLKTFDSINIKPKKATSNKETVLRNT